MNFHSETIHAGQLAVFEESSGAIELQADGITSFVIGSAIKHPHPLVLGRYSVHTSAEALAQGEGEIQRISQRLRAEGRRMRPLQRSAHTSPADTKGSHHSARLRWVTFPGKGTLMARFS